MQVVSPTVVLSMHLTPEFRQLLSVWNQVLKALTSHNFTTVTLIVPVGSH